MKLLKQLVALLFVSQVVKSADFSSNDDVSTESRVKLVGNGYEDIVVAVSPDVKSDKALIIINKIKELFTDASKVLYRVTKQKFYFKSVRILVPEFWTVANTRESDWETYQTADVRIGPGNWEYKNKPFTVHASGCGLPGEFIYLTPEYLQTWNNSVSLKNAQSPGEALVREWAKFRYGLLKDKVKRLGDLFSESVETESQGESEDSEADDRLPSMKSFLNDPQKPVLRDESYVTKKKGAVKGCGLRSAWSVLQEHGDFSVNEASVVDIVPSFKIVQSKAARIVLVMDVSGSMQGNRMKDLRESTERWIRYEISNKSYLGLVEFNNSASTTSPLELVGTHRDDLISRLPQFPNGTTCIGCGLLAAVNALEKQGSAKGGVIVLISDGGENVDPKIPAVLKNLTKAEVRVVSIAFGSQADPKIELLAKETRGKSFYINEQTRANVDQYFREALESVLSYQPALSSDKLQVQIFEHSFEIHQVTGSFFVDATIGRNLTISFSLTQSSITQGHVESFTLTSPRGTVYNKRHLSFIRNQGIATLTIPEAAVGNWKFGLRLQNIPPKVKLHVKVTSQSRNGAPAPLVAECFFDQPKEDFGKAAVDDRSSVRVYASVKQGSNPVVRTRKVMAYVTSPKSPKPIEIPLSDSASSPVDAIADDGIYTGIFNDMTEQGRYIVRCVAEGDGDAYVKNGFPANVTRPGNFHRTAVAGSFTVTEKILNNTKSTPPGRITDLRLMAIDSDDWQFGVEFTAPGDRLYSGTVKKYEMSYSSSLQELRQVFQGAGSSSAKEANLVKGDMIIWKSLKPLEAGSLQQVGVKIRRPESETNATYYVVVRGVSHSGIPGPPSNVVTVRFKIKRTGRDIDVTDEPPEIIDDEPTDVQLEIDEEDSTSHESLVDGAGALVANFKFIILVIITLNFAFQAVV